MEITKARNPLFLEACDPSDLHPVGYFSPPERFVEPHTEGRLIEQLREGARRAKDEVIRALVEAVLAWLDGDTDLAFALADLTVTGRAASGNFFDLNPNDTDLSAEVIRVVGREIEPAALTLAVSSVLDRAYEALWNIFQRGNERTVGWIAVCAEVDPPYRPVNIPGTSQTQFDTSVSVQATGLTPERDVQTRYAIFDQANRPAEIDMDEVVRLRQLPTMPVPVISEASRLLIYIHGHSARLEEGEKLGKVFNGHPFTVISMDLPCNGYAEMIEHSYLADASNTDTLEAFPLLEFIEQYIIDFVAAIGIQVGRPIENQVAAMIGGSLGGNISLRLARRELDDHPWMNNFVAWSAASVWTPYTGPGIETGPNTARARMQQSEIPESRAEYIRQVFDESFSIIFTVVRPQGEYWYRDGWEPCKARHLAGDRQDRREVYNGRFRRWHWRVALEQMLFSHRHPTSRLEKLRGRLLLMAGEGDDYPWTHIRDSTRDMAMLAINTPGTLRLLKNTGHSIHAERPNHLASEIEAFLPFPTPIDDTEHSGWIDWVSIGGRATSTPTVIANEDGRLEIFARDENNRIWRSTQSSVNGVWRRETIQMDGGLDSEDTFGSFAVERNWDGRLEIFAFYEKEGWVAHAWQDAPNGSWHDWNKGSKTDGQLIGDAADGVFAVERFGEAPGEIGGDGLRFDVGRRWLLVGSRRSDGRVHIRGQDSDGWQTYGRDLGQDTITFVGTPVATRLLNGRLIVFAQDSSNILWSICEESPDHWQEEWQQFSEEAVSSDVSAALDADGKLTVAVRTVSGQIGIRRQIFPNGDWGEWETMPADLASSSKPVLIRNPWGELQLFVHWIDGTVRTRRQRLGLIREWADWGNLGGNIAYGPVVAPQHNGMPIVFCVGVDGELYYSFIAHHTSREVTAVRKDGDTITHLCNEEADWSPVDVVTAIEEIVASEQEYSVLTPEGLRSTIVARRILTTPPDATRENNLDSLPVLRPENTGWPSPPDDLRGRRVTHVLKYGDDSLLSILGLCNVHETWCVDRLTAFHQIRAGTHHYFIEADDGNRIEIVARQFLTTSADEVAENNLDNLPEC